MTLLSLPPAGGPPGYFPFSSSWPPAAFSFLLQQKLLVADFILQIALFQATAAAFSSSRPLWAANIHTKGCICNSVIRLFLAIFPSEFLPGDRGSLSPSDITVLKGGFLVSCPLEDQPSSKQTKASRISYNHAPIFHYHFITSFPHSSEARIWYLAPFDFNPFTTYSV